MKLHLPLSLRSALLAACALLGLSSHSSYAADSSPARYWVDAEGVRHELEYDNEYIDINGATSFTLQNHERVEEDTDKEDTDKEDAFVEGGALILRGESIIQADTVNIVGNKVTSSAELFENAYSEGGAIESYGSLSFTNCKQINITGNAAILQYKEDIWTDEPTMPLGGAICMNFGMNPSINEGMLEFKGNDKVVIRGNYVMANVMVDDEVKDIVELCAIDTSWIRAHVAFEVRAGQEVICYDGIGVDGILFINANTLDPGKWDKDYTGTVTFTGEDTVELLTAIKGSAPDELEIERSRTISAGQVYVHAGTLVLNQVTMSAAVDDEFYNYYETAGLSTYGHFYSTKDAEVQMINSTIHTCWYWWTGKNDDILIEQQASLYMGNVSFSGHNTLKANYIKGTDSTWTFHVQSENKKQAVVSIEFDQSRSFKDSEPFFNTEGGATFHISVAKGLAKGEYKLLEFDSKLGEWLGRENVTLSGAAEGKITEGKGDVYYTVGSDSMLTLWFDYNGGADEEAPGMDDPGEPEKPAAPSTPAEKPASKLTWTAPSGTWSTDEGVWNGESTFHTGDGVVFDRACEVSVRHTVRPGSIEVSNEDGVVTLKKGKNGQITGAASLVKTGAGELSIKIANAFTGGTTIKAGTVTLGDAQALGLGGVKMSGGTLDMGSKAVENAVEAGGAVSILRGTKYAGDMTLSKATLSESNISIAAERSLTITQTTLEHSRITLNEGASMRVDELVLGGSLVTEGKQSVDTRSVLTLGGAEVDGNITLAGGRLLVTAANGSEEAAQTIDGDLALHGGTLALNGTLEVTGTLSSTERVSVQLQDELLKQLGKEGSVKLMSARDMDDLDATHLRFGQLKNARQYELSTEDGVSLTVQNAELHWAPGVAKVWGVALPVEWQAEGVEDKTFHDLDRVVFEDAGDVIIVGEVMPGEITVKGSAVFKDGSLSLPEIGDLPGLEDLAGLLGKERAAIPEPEAGSITGSATLTKEGEGTLRIATDNSKYTGDIIVTGGTLELAHQNALGTGSAVRIENATFDGGSLTTEREIWLSGSSAIKRADRVAKLRFADRSTIRSGEGGFKLTTGQMLTVGENVSFEGDFIFQGGGMLSLEGGCLDLTRAKVSFEANPMADVLGDTNVDLDEIWDQVPDSLKGSLQALKSRLETVKDLLDNNGENGLDVTVIDLRGREDLDAGGDYTLLKLGEVEGSLSAEDIAAKFVVYMDDMAMAFYQELTLEDGELKLHISNPEMNDSIVSSLSRNQRSVYDALHLMSMLVESDGELNELRREIFRSGVTEAEAKAALDALSGAELATVLTSQVEGNLAHLRRLRANMGSGQRIDKEGKNTVYFVGYDDMNRVDATEDGPGMKRTEWGGTLGFERCIREESLFGFAITSGSATVTPTLGEEYDGDSLRVDFYAVGNMGKGWQALMSVGAGKHTYSTTRHIGPHTAKADIDGFSVNFQQEVSYTKQFNEQHALQPFVAFEVTADVVNSFTETGAGSASLESKDSATTAADITLGARYIYSFQAGGGRKGNVSLQAAVVVRKGESTSELDLHFTGVQHRQFNVAAAAIDSVGYNLGLGVLVPVSKYAAFTLSGNAVMRSGAKEAGASVGLRLTF